MSAGFVPTPGIATVTTPHRSVHVRVIVDDERGWTVDLSTLLGRDWVRGVQITDSADAPMATATIRLQREFFDVSLVPGKASRANYNGSSVADVLLETRRIYVDVQLQPEGASADTSQSLGLGGNSPTWRRRFDGVIDTINIAADDCIELACRDHGARLQDAFITGDASGNERAYNVGGTASLKATIQQILDDQWFVSAYAVATYASGAAVRPTTRNGYYYTASAGAASAEPTWPTTLGSTVVDGAVTWTCAGELPTLYEPSASGLVLGQFRQARGPLLDAIRSLAQQNGWDCRYIWDTATVAYRLTLFGPDRTGMSSLLTAYNTQDIIGVRELKRGIESVRNVVQVRYTAAGVVKSTQAYDATSQSLYGVRFCEFSEDSTKGIDTDAEAAALAAAALADLKSPKWSGSVAVLADPTVEIGANISLPSSGEGLRRYLDADTSFRVTGVTFAVDGNGASTTLALQGGAVWHQDAWLRREIRPGLAPSRPMLRDGVAAIFAAYLHASQSVASGAFARILYDTEQADPTGSFDSTSTKGTFTAPRSGLYAFDAAVQLASVNDGTQVQIALYKNGAVQLVEPRIADVTGTFTARIATAGLWLAVGDTVDVRVKHDDSSSRSTTVDGPIFTGRRLN